VNPSRTALLVIDPLNDFISEGGKLWPYAKDVAERVSLVPNLRRLLAAGREAGLSIVYVPHHRSEPGEFDGWRYLCPTHVGAKNIRPFERGSWGGDYHPQLAPAPGELVVHEHWLHNGFANTDLAMQLQVRGIDRVILAGMRANTCVEATARHAVELGYHVTLAKDAMAAFRWEEWVATVEVNAPAFAHAILSTDEIIESLRRS
jgi:nicotinamidase-related amidase